MAVHHLFPKKEEEKGGGGEREEEGDAAEERKDKRQPLNTITHATFFKYVGLCTGFLFVFVFNLKVSLRCEYVF